MSGLLVGPGEAQDRHKSFIQKNLNQRFRIMYDDRFRLLLLIMLIMFL